MTATGPSKSVSWVRAVALVAVGAAVLFAAAPTVPVAGEPSSVPPRQIRWLAAGDSYSSGEGLNDTFEPTCQRATGENPGGEKAWAVLTRDQLGAQLPLGGRDKPFDFVACTGAKSSDLFAATNGKKEWDPTYNGQFDLVTFSFGGNDIDFSKVIFQCQGWSAENAAAIAAGQAVSPAGGVGTWLLKPRCPDEDEVKARIDTKVGDPATYRDFLNRVAWNTTVPGGKIVVVGYPEVIADPGLWHGTAGLFNLCHGITAADAPHLRGIAGHLNATIGQAVADVNAVKPNGVELVFVDVHPTFEPDGNTSHNLCGNAPEWINGLTSTKAPVGNWFNRSFHPRQEGHAAQAQEVAERISQLGWDGLAEPEPTGRVEDSWFMTNSVREDTVDPRWVLASAGQPLSGADSQLVSVYRGNRRVGLMLTYYDVGASMNGDVVYVRQWVSDSVGDGCTRALEDPNNAYLAAMGWDDIGCAQATGKAGLPVISYEGASTYGEPSPTAEVAEDLPANSARFALCITTGAAVEPRYSSGDPSDVWLKLEDGTYLSDLFAAGYGGEIDEVLPPC